MNFKDRFAEGYGYDMADAVKIKMFPNGITISMKEDVSFEELLEELAQKFEQGKNFFGSASMALSLEGRALSDAEEIRILEVIRRHSRLNVICIVGHDEETNRKFIKALHQVERRLSGEKDGQFYKGSLTDKQVLETEGSIVILGDVNPGCAVIAAGNIIVLGGLYGEAYAGGNQAESYVVALEMEPERLHIGDFKYKSKEKQSKWGIRPKVQPKIAYVKNERILMEPLTKELLSSF